MVTCLETCIYCRAGFNAARGEGDHIIPAALGEFRDDVRFRRVCPQCNNRIGRSEQQFLQCGPEALFRELVCPALPRRRKRGRSRTGGALGMRGPQFLMSSVDHTQMVEPVPGRPHDAQPVDQFVVRGKDGGDHHFPLFIGMSAECLRDRVARAGISTFDVAWLHCDQARWSQYSALVHGAWPGMKLGELPTTEAGTHRVDGQVRFTVSDHYFRTVAKIAFHYYLVHTRRRLQGDEREFASIRRFILHGGSREPFFETEGPRFQVPFGRLPTGSAITPSHWCHVLGADETSEAVFAYVHLFAGPRSPGSAHRIRLGELNSRIIVPSHVSVWGHVYLYEREQPAYGHAGRVMRASVRRIR